MKKFGASRAAPLLSALTRQRSRDPAGRPATIAAKRCSTSGTRSERLLAIGRTT